MLAVAQARLHECEAEHCIRPACPGMLGSEEDCREQAGDT